LTQEPADQESKKEITSPSNAPLTNNLDVTQYMQTPQDAVDTPIKDQPILENKADVISYESSAPTTQDPCGAT